MKNCGIDAKAAKHLSEGLALNKALKTLKYAALDKPIPIVLTPHDGPFALVP